MKKISLVMVSLFFLGAAAKADTLVQRTASFEPSVRASAMGGAYAGFYDDEFGHFYNPAISVSRNAVGLVYDKGLYKDNTGALSFALPQFWKAFNLGVSAVYYDSGSEEYYDPITGSLYKETLQRDWLAVLNMSKDFCYGISAGANVKFLNSKIIDESASSMLFDLGVLWRQNRFELGASFQNLGGSLKYTDEDESIANTFRVGGSANFDIAGQLLTAGADFVKTQELDSSVRLGAELLIEKMFAVRAGYEYRDDNDLALGLTLGAGIKMSDFKIDYAFVPYKNDVDGNEHKIGFAYFFGPEKEHTCVHGGKCVNKEEKQEEPAPPVEEAKEEPEEEKYVSKMVLRTTSEKANANKFAFDSHDVSESDKEKIKEIAIKYNVDSVKRIRVEGHTDDVGALEYNQKLSEKRAQNVADILIKGGVNPEKVKVKGFGKERPIADNSNEEGASQNRRVEIYIDEEQEVQE